NKSKKSTLNIIYTGTLDKYKRNPQYACDVFKEIANIDFSLKFFSKGNSAIMLENYEKLTNKKIIRNGFVSHSEILEETNNATFLLSIGNTESDLIPSKIFEYLSTGKPIIHFYDNENDSSLVYLKKYPLSLLVKKDDNKFDVNLLKVESFMKEFKNKIVPFEKVESIFNFNKPEYTENKI